MTPEQFYENWVKKVDLYKRFEVFLKRMDIEVLVGTLMEPDAWIEKIEMVWGCKTVFVSQQAPSNDKIMAMTKLKDHALFGVQAIARKEITWTHL
jgi:hypothetical protein